MSREENWKICMRYIDRTRTLFAAKELAAKDGIKFHDDVWLLAWSQQPTADAVLTKPNKPPKQSRYDGPREDAVDRYEGIRQFLYEARNR